jgi:adenylate cyclase
LIASEDFATYCGGGWVTIGKEKLRGVRQRLTILHPDMSDIADNEDESAFEISYDGVSDAEQMMLLLRESGLATLSKDGGKTHL